MSGVYVGAPTGSVSLVSFYDVKPAMHFVSHVGTYLSMLNNVRPTQLAVSAVTMGLLFVATGDVHTAVD